MTLKITISAPGHNEIGWTEWPHKTHINGINTSNNNLEFEFKDLP